MRLFALAAVVVAFAVSTVACSAGNAGTTQSGTGANGGNGTATGANGGTTGGAATCDDACDHYLGCKNADTADNHQSCVSQCAALNRTPDQLADYMQTDCPTAIAEVDGPTPAPSTGGSTPDCNNCHWDGSSCIWLTETAPVSTSCDAVCCPGH